MAKKPKRIGILTGGGDCPGLNAVIRAVVKNARREGIEVVGILDGFHGLMEDMTRELDYDGVSGILVQGGTILGSSNKDNPFRHPLVSPGGKVRYIDRTPDCLATLERHGIEVLVVLGGDGTMTVANRLVKHGVKVVGVPKTIDNDLEGTDQTFGYDTAMTVAAEAIDRLHSVAASHHRVMVVEVMGRYAGWLPLGAGLASGGDVILLPEFPYREDKIVEAIRCREASGRHFSIVVVGEGAKPAGGKMVVDKIRPLSPEKIRLGGIGKVLADRIEELTNMEARAVVLGHVIRGGTPSPTDRKLATLFGVAAMDLVLAGRSGFMVGLRGTRILPIPISKVGGKTRYVTRDHPWVKAAVKIGVSLGI